MVVVVDRKPWTMRDAVTDAACPLVNLNDLPSHPSLNTCNHDFRCSRNAQGRYGRRYEVEFGAYSKRLGMDGRGHHRITEDEPRMRTYPAIQ